MTIISLVYAQSRNGIIGDKGDLPWRLPSDLKRFKTVTLGKPVIMGRKTWDSLPRKPLPGRPNIIITRQSNISAEGATVVKTIDDALKVAGPVEEVCIIGGAEIYRSFLPRAHRIYLTEINLSVAGDTEAPTLNPTEWTEVSRDHHPAQPGDSADFMLRILERKSNEFNRIST
jgi:dihydrofolate reductase